MTSLNLIGQRLASNLLYARQYDEGLNREAAHVEKVNVVGAGGVLTAAYEQLRNAAENTEEHLLLQKAIRRFYKQLFVTRDEKLVHESGSELAIELTFACYVRNDSMTKTQLDKIAHEAVVHYHVYEILQKRRSINADRSSKWILDTLAVRIERLINSHASDNAFVDVAYAYYETIAPPEAVNNKKHTAEDYSAALFVGIHQALLKSNEAVVRSALLDRYQVTVDDTDAYVSYNKRIDKLLVAPLTEKLYRIVDRQGAPLRIVRRMMEDRADFTDLLPRREVFLEAYEQQVNREYANIGQRINRAIVRSVIFLIITKVLIGVAVEVPYDIWAHGEIIWGPLLINLGFPPLYMVALRLTHTLPSYANTTALVDRVDAMLYGERTVLVRKQLVGQKYGPIFSFIYTSIGLIVFGGATWLLLMLHFSLVHIAIFFVFISAASFLGFRISRLIRELEIVNGASNGLTFIRDMIYLPFVIVGQWMSDKYSQLNIVGLVLDMVIELPLKTVLRLVRQWGAFLDDRKDRI
ncbi:MAG: hypothetical protein ABIP74_00070 [Candidatus Saccharimonas sp.]